MSRSRFGSGGHGAEVRAFARPTIGCQPMSEPFIRLTNVGKIYQTKTGPTEACLDISLDIRESEFVAIVGPSGCGKTTILKMVAGLAPYTTGSITIGGARVDRPQTDVGIVFHEGIMLDWRGVLE